MATFTYLNGATNEAYSPQAFSYISNQRVKESIISTSSILGVSTGAIAGAMAEENTAYDFVDEVLDAYAKSGIDPSEALGTLLQAIVDDTVSVAEWMATHASQLGTKRTHADWQAYYAAAQSYQGAPGVRDKIRNPALIDAGPGNFKIATAIELVIQHADKPEYSALDLALYRNDYVKLVDDLTDPAGELTAKLYGLYMKEHAEAFFKSNAAYAGQWQNLPQTLRDALLVTYTNRGEQSMLKTLKTPYEPQPGMTVSGGMNHVRNAKAIGSALGISGYGEDAVGVDDFLNQAKTAGTAGLAARYALQQLRYVAIENIDYGTHNADGSLDLYDEATGKGAMSTNYLQDRAEMLVWKTLYDVTGTDYNDDYNTAEIEGNWDYIDKAMGLVLSIDGSGMSLSDHQIVFGSASGEAINGSGDSDRLYGMGGDDQVYGGKGNDYLEGGDDNDVLEAIKWKEIYAQVA